MMDHRANWRHPEHIVECDWLNRRINDKNLRVFDCTTFLHYCDDNPSKPYDVESGFENYKLSHIPGASFLDLQKQLSDNESPYKFTLPNLNVLHELFCNVGISDGFKIILYSANGLQWSTRVWWMLYILGFKNHSVLDGGFDEWRRLGFPTENKVNTFAKGYFNFVENSFTKMFVDRKPILGGMKKEFCLILNALTNDIHSGKNPRYGRRGRIPGSLNIPFHDLIDPLTSKLKSAKEVKDIIAKYGITDDYYIINYCGGGIAASLNAFVLFQLGFNKLQIYDNSLSEWAKNEELPLEVD